MMKRLLIVATLLVLLIVPSVALTLEQNYPNPFNSSTTIRFKLDLRSEFVSIVIYNSLGQEITTLVNDYYLSPGAQYSVQWTPTSNLASGVYIYVLKTTTRMVTRRMMYLK